MRSDHSTNSLVVTEVTEHFHTQRYHHVTHPPTDSLNSDPIPYSRQRVSFGGVSMAIKTSKIGKPTYLTQLSARLSYLSATIECPNHLLRETHRLTTAAVS